MKRRCMLLDRKKALAFITLLLVILTLFPAQTLKGGTWDVVGSFDPIGDIGDTPVSLSNGTFNTSVTVEELIILYPVFIGGNGSWDTTVVLPYVAPPGTPITDISGSFDTTVYIEYYIWGNWSEWWEITFINFAEPSNLFAQSINNNTINLTWTPDANATHTYIRRKMGSAPVNMSDGEEVVYTAGSSYSDTGLNIGTHYYYSAWAYNDTQSIWSDNYATANNHTRPGDPSNLIISDTTMYTQTLNWTEGVNRTHSVLVQNESGYANYPSTPTNGTVIFNATGVSKLNTGLEINTTYYYSLWSFNDTSGFFSDNYETVSDKTIEEPGVPQNLFAQTWNDTRINLTWFMANASHGLVIRMQEHYYPGLNNGTEIFNSTGSSYQKFGLNASTPHYFRAWGWNGEEYSVSYSSHYNITLPQPPQNYTGILEDTTLNMTWNKGIGADYTMIRNTTTAYPGKETGNLIYNDTGENKEVTATAFAYFRAWSYNATYNLYSEGVNLLWGGLYINVWKEPEPAIAITNYTVFITNQQGTETYENTTANNPFVIDVNDVPHGNKTAIQVSRDGYYTQIQYRDLFPNVWYFIDFYLAPDIEGGGDEGEPDYIPPDDTDNESYGELYLLTVEDPWTNPVEQAKVEIQRYINTTGVEEYKTITIRYTDANGQVDVYLIPGGLYKVIISKTNYNTEYADYIPSDSIFTKTFRLTFAEGEPEYEETLWTGITWRISPLTAYHRTNITILYNISSSLDQLEYFGMTVSWYNVSSDSWLLLNTQNITTQPGGGEITYTTPNATGRYSASFWFKKANFSLYTFSGSDGICRLFFITWEQITEQLQDIPVDVYFLIAIVLAIAAMGLLVRFGATELAGFVGLMIMTIAFMMRPDMTIGGLPWYFVLLVTGIIYAVIMFLRGRV
jgi:hypothetical protein